MKSCLPQKHPKTTPLKINAENNEQEGLVQMIFPMQMGDFQVPAVNFPGV